MIITPQRRQINWLSPQVKGLIGFWPLDEMNSNIYDMMKRTGNGTPVNSPASIITPAGPMKSFNGSNQYIALPHIPVLSTWSLAVNFIMGSVAGNYEIATKRSTTTTGIVDCQLDVYNNTLRFIITDDTSTTVSTTTAVSANTFYNAVAVRNVNSLNLYVNGILKNSATGTIGAISNINTFDIGCLCNGGLGRSVYFSGNIGNVLFYNRALSAREVANLYSNTDGIWVKPRGRMLYVPPTALKQRRTLSQIGTRTASRQGY
jgi:hypothetical protein